MQFQVFVIGLIAILGITASEKVSPRPGLISFRDDYDSVAKTCVAVGFVKENCKNNRDKKNIIAFNAKAKDSVQTVNSGSTIIFGAVDLNKGGGFNAVKGIFTAPKSGVYVFDWTTNTQQNKYAFTALYINGKSNVYSYCHNNGHGLRMSCSKMAVVRMETGDKASIKCFSNTAVVYHEYTSFSGFML